MEDGKLPVIQAVRVESQSRHLAEVRKTRKKLDTVSEQLSNRLQFLQREESKVLKSILLARAKASQIVSIKTHAASHRARLSTHKQETLEKEKQQRTANIQMESVAEDRIAHVSRLVRVHKQNDARAMKLMKAVLNLRNAEQQQELSWHQRARVRALRNRTTDAPLSVALFRQEKRDLVGNWHHHRLLSEIQRRHSRLAEISALEEERMNVVQRLTLTQREQEDAEEELREAIRESCEPLVV